MDVRWPGAPRDGRLNGGGHLARGLQRSAFGDEPRDACRSAIFPQSPDDGRQISLGQVVHDPCGRERVERVHSHVQRAVREGSAYPSRVIQLVPSTVVLMSVI